MNFAEPADPYSFSRRWLRENRWTALAGIASSLFFTAPRICQKRSNTLFSSHPAPVMNRCWQTYRPFSKKTRRVRLYSTATWLTSLTKSSKIPHPVRSRSGSSDPIAFSACSVKAEWASSTSPNAWTFTARWRSKFYATPGSRPLAACDSRASSKPSRSSTTLRSPASMTPTRSPTARRSSSWNMWKASRSSTTAKSTIARSMSA